MYYFPNLDDTTRLIMVTELEMDLKGVNKISRLDQGTTPPIEKGLFYVPKSIKPDFVCAYKKLLKSTFEKGDVNSLKKIVYQASLKIKIKL